MEPRPAPALLPAAALVAGAVAGLRWGWHPPWLLAALLAAGVARRGRAGLAVAACALGLAAAAVRGDGDVPRTIEPWRPVAATGTVADHWRDDGDERSVRFRLAVLRQGPAVAVARMDVRLVVPAAGEPPPPGSRLRVRGALRRSPGFANGIAVPPGPWRLRVESARLVEPAGAPGMVSRLAHRLRRRVEAGHAAALAAATAAGESSGAGPALVRALVLADTGGVPPAWQRGLRRTGLAHVLAVSGLHVGLVAAAALLAGAALPWRSRLALSLVVVGAYVLLAGPRPSLLRAALMGGLAGAALLGSRAPQAANALAVAVAALVVHRPSLVDDLGFRLTATATAGIVLLAPRLAAAWEGGRRRPREAPPPGPAGRLAAGLVRALAATVGAQLASFPIALPAFHLASLSAPLTNLVAVPWTALALVVALAWTGLCAVAPDLAGAVLPVVDAVARPFGWPARGGPRAWGTVAAAAPWPAAVLLAALLALWFQRPVRRLALLLAVVALVPAWRWGSGGPARHPGLELAALDVGQGDAVLLRDGAAAVLVDGGGWPRGDLGGRVLVPALLAEGLTRLDAVVLTHGDRDHCGGLVDLASYLPLGAVWLSAAEPAAGGCAAELVAAAARQGAPARRLRAGERLAVGRWRLHVLHPRAGAAPGRSDNDASLVLLAEAAGRRALLTGDVQAAAEGELVRRHGSLLAADVLKVAHHGSASSSGAAFLAAVAPRLALVSAGAGNPYGHPAPAVLARLAARRCAVLRTDRHGMVHLAWGAPGEPPRLALGRPVGGGP